MLGRQAFFVGRLFKLLMAVYTIDALTISARMENLYFPDFFMVYRSIHVEKISWSMEST